MPKISIVREGNTLTARISGALDAPAVARVSAAIDTATSSAPPTALALDLAGVTFIDTTGLGMLVGYRNECLAQDVDLVLQDVPHRVRRMFEITGLHTVFRLEDTVDPSA